MNRLIQGVLVALLISNIGAAFPEFGPANTDAVAASAHGQDRSEGAALVAALDRNVPDFAMWTGTARNVPDFAAAGRNVPDRSAARSAET